MDLRESGAVLSTQVAPPLPANPFESGMDLEHSRAVLSAQIVTQHSQLLASSGKETPRMKFYKGEPLALGVTQVLIGILGIAFGIVLDLANYYTPGYIVVKTPYWTGILYILSGSLSVAAARNPKMPIVKAMLGMNALSAVAAGFGIVILSISLAFSHFSWYDVNLCSHVEAPRFRECYENQVIFQYIQNGMLGVFLVFNILEFCIGISGATFGCKAACQETFVGTVVVVYQNKPPGDAVSNPAPCKDAENP